MAHTNTCRDAPDRYLASLCLIQLMITLSAYVFGGCYIYRNNIFKFILKLRIGQFASAGEILSYIRDMSAMSHVIIFDTFFFIYWAFFNKIYSKSGASNWWIGHVKSVQEILIYIRDLSAMSHVLIFDIVLKGWVFFNKIYSNYETLNG